MFDAICSCGLTDWCPRKDEDCGHTNPKLLERVYTPSPRAPLSELAAPLLEKFGKGNRNV